MWNTLYRIAISIMLAGTLSCCIKNDIPFAKVPLSITGIEVEGQSGSAVISENESTVTVTLQETVNPKKVMLKTFTYTEKASSTLTAGTEIDLSQPYEVTLSLYQDYKWEIIGNQPIARRMIIDGQLGNSEFDVENHLATASIRKSADLKDIVLSDLKLGPEGALNDGVSGTPEVQWTFYRDFAQASVHVTFSDFVDETWTLRVYKSDKDVVTESADGWVNVAWLYGAGVADTECGFDIREDGSEDWTRVDQKYVTMDGGQFTARVPHLKANTTYECRAYSGDQVGDVVKACEISLKEYVEAPCIVCYGTCDEEVKELLHMLPEMKNVTVHKMPLSEPPEMETDGIYGEVLMEKQEWKKRIKVQVKEILKYKPEAVYVNGNVFSTYPVVHALRKKHVPVLTIMENDEEKLIVRIPSGS